MGQLVLGCRSLSLLSRSPPSRALQGTAGDVISFSSDSGHPVIMIAESTMPRCHNSGNYKATRAVSTSCAIALSRLSPSHHNKLPRHEQGPFWTY